MAETLLLNLTDENFIMLLKEIYGLVQFSKQCFEKFLNSMLGVLVFNKCKGYLILLKTCLYSGSSFSHFYQVLVETFTSKTELQNEFQHSQ